MASGAILGAVVFGVVPLCFIFVYSLHDWNPLSGTFTFTGLDNFVALFASASFQESLWVTVQFFLAVVVSETALALVLAAVLNRRVRAVGLFRSAYFVPVVVAYLAWALVWEYLLASNGTINSILARIGITGPNWLHDPSTALPALVLVVLFKGVGQNMVIFLAALQSVPSELGEAANLDGAGPVRRFWSITFPLITPSVMMVLILTTVGALNIFVPVQVLTGGGPGNATNVISYYLYDVAFQQQEFGRGSAVGVVLFVIVLALTLGQWAVRRKWVHGES